MRIYIAGPMSGLPDNNYPAFNAAAARFRAAGHEVMNPAENPQQWSWEAYMKVSIPQMISCDRVIMLPGWETSRGARIEKELAHELLIPVYVGSLGVAVPGIEDAGSPIPV